MPISFIPPAPGNSLYNDTGYFRSLHNNKLLCSISSLCFSIDHPCHLITSSLDFHCCFSMFQYITQSQIPFRSTYIAQTHSDISTYIAQSQTPFRYKYIYSAATDTIQIHIHILVHLHCQKKYQHQRSKKSFHILVHFHSQNCEHERIKKPFHLV